MLLGWPVKGIEDIDKSHGLNVELNLHKFNFFYLQTWKLVCFISGFYFLNDSVSIENEIKNAIIIQFSFIKLQ